MVHSLQWSYFYLLDLHCWATTKHCLQLHSDWNKSYHAHHNAFIAREPGKESLKLLATITQVKGARKTLETWGLRPLYSTCFSRQAFKLKQLDSSSYLATPGPIETPRCFESHLFGKDVWSSKIIEIPRAFEECENPKHIFCASAGFPGGLRWLHARRRPWEFVRRDGKAKV